MTYAIRLRAHLPALQPAARLPAPSSQKITYFAAYLHVSMGPLNDDRVAVSTVY